MSDGQFAVIMEGQFLILMWLADTPFRRLLSFLGFAVAFVGYVLSVWP
jgi:hypothetical protein